MNLFFGIFLIDVVAMGIMYLIGKYAVEKEHKDTWDGAPSMEIRESNKLSKEWTEAHPVLDFLQSFYYECGRKWEMPGDFIDNVKYFIQRGKKGYSRRDVWGFYYYLTHVMIDGLKDLQSMVHGCPGGIGNSMAIDIDEESEGTKEWKRIIGEIIWTFEAIKKVEDHDWVMVTDEEKRKEFEEYVDRLNAPDNEPLFPDLPPHEWHLMTKEEMERYHKGWEYFKEYFMYLGD